MKVFFFLNIAVFALTLGAWNTSQANSSSTKSFNGVATLEQSLGLYDQADGNRMKSLGLRLLGSYLLSSEYRISGDLTGYIDQNNSDESDLGYAYLGLSRTSKILIPSVVLSLPVSKTHKFQSFQGGISPRVAFNMKSLFWPSSAFELHLGLSGARNFYQYDMSFEGRSNTQYSLLQSIGGGYEFSKGFSISLTFIHFNSWDFSGRPGESWGHDQEASYDFSKNFTLALGHRFGNPTASIYRADGQTLNFNLLSETDSYVYSYVRYSF